ncbi:hypothetical protein [uncultured Thiodictyon sp.]|uniref:hypothetical protein n=1 Tax=uncultured Thiodictyon sp. TaxID=1846217 RepID=UPI0025D55CB2|nr:hypothetical protein [uncultured Thiodictyon sp.]
MPETASYFIPKRPLDAEDRKALAQEAIREQVGDWTVLMLQEYLRHIGMHQAQLALAVTCDDVSAYLLEKSSREA